MGAARPSGGAFHGWTYAPVNETDRAARAVLDMIGVEIPDPVAEAPVVVEEPPKPKRRPRAKVIEGVVEAPPETPAPKPRKPRTTKPKA